jgi:hypothetical protein
MRGRWAFAALGILALVALTAACACGGGKGAPAALPASGAEVCDDLNESERFRYTLKYVLDSPQQENPATDPPAADPAGSYVIKPSQPDFTFETTHAGAAVRPDRLDFEISTTPDQPTTRTIRIGESQWFLLGEQWQQSPEPGSFPFTPPNVCQAFVAPLDLSGKTADLQNVNDKEARHVRVEGVSMEAASLLFGPASDMGRLLKNYDVDIWLEKGKDRLVKVEAVSRADYPYGRELSLTVVMDVSAYNDDEIDIQPPQTG